jgi:hypothetical protein
MTHIKVCTRTLNERKLVKDQLGKDEREPRKGTMKGNHERGTLKGEPKKSATAHGEDCANMLAWRWIVASSGENGIIYSVLRMAPKS